MSERDDRDEWNDAEMDALMDGREYFYRTLFARYVRDDGTYLWVHAKPESKIEGMGLGDVLVLPRDTPIGVGDRVRWRRLVSAPLDAHGYYSVNDGPWRSDGVSVNANKEA